MWLNIESSLGIKLFNANFQLEFTSIPQLTGISL